MNEKPSIKFKPRITPQQVTQALVKGKARKSHSKPKEKPKAQKRKNVKPEKMAGDVLEFNIPKGLNPYNFIHIPKAAVSFLPFKVGEKLHGHIDIEKQALVITKA